MFCLEEKIRVLKVHQPYYFKTLGFGLARLWKSKSENVLFVLIIYRVLESLFLLKVWLVPCIALESLKLGAILLPRSFNKSSKSNQGCPRGRRHRSKGVPPRDSEKQVANKTRWPGKRSCKWLENGNPNLKVGRIVNLSIDYSIILGSILASFL